MPECKWICNKGKRKGETCNRPTKQKDKDDRYVCGSHLSYMKTLESKESVQNETIEKVDEVQVEEPEVQEQLNTVIEDPVELPEIEFKNEIEEDIVEPTKKKDVYKRMLDRQYENDKDQEQEVQIIPQPVLSLGLYAL